MVSSSRKPRTLPHGMCLWVLYTPESLRFFYLDLRSGNSPSESRSEYDDPQAGVDPFIHVVDGWTNPFRDTDVALSVRDKFHCDGEVPPHGTYDCPSGRSVLFRTSAEGPFGPVARTDWIEHSGVLLVAGGSGVSFGPSMLVYPFG